MDTELLQILWYSVFILSMFAYAALDGFDIGVGCLHLFAKTDYDRRIFLNAIGPVWDSNSLWVVITSGVLLSGFPMAFSVLFSALYLPMMLLVFGYIYRAVAIEFRSKINSPKWRRYWDCMFAGSSYCLAIGFGVVLANLIHGLPIDEQGHFVKDLSVLLSPYALLLGCFTTLLFMVHGALYLAIKTVGNLHDRLYRWCWRLFVLFAVVWVIVNSVTPLLESQVIALIAGSNGLWLFYPLVFLGLSAVVAMGLSIKRRSYAWAFLASAGVILSLIVCYTVGTYPNIVRSSLNEAYSLTIFNASSTPFTLKILLTVAAIGTPLFFLYILYSYRVFRGKVEIDTMSY